MLTPIRNLVDAPLAQTGIRACLVWLRHAEILATVRYYILR
jgi:hypothetical protein